MGLQKLCAGFSAALLVTGFMAAAEPAMAGKKSGSVQAMIKAQAPKHGVPVWFALRIAKVESGFNPRVRGRAGEYGVYQLKCQTARGLGFRGNCRQLLNPATNIHYGLKHLSIAVRSSKGNLKLAASKHNGGLGRKRIVRKYVNLVF
jgi:soluble lytic murein transglycosylase-like protein